ncbi:hypothetical protein WICMUC_000760 [Wickerhamomyces mucosus]|uniref:TLC domain-containing protein n=1 Tax=Wickerhamomyces mucosus TaxID=1378264 RepID=A0A9P8TI64_9ASCO|nr:hypothetical protein WICMUC_000760 [Wickerhamomyces mucosus]
MNVGYRRVRSLSTSKESPEDLKASRDRITSLSRDSKTDTEIISKILTAFIELNYRHTWLSSLLILLITYGSYLLSGNYTESNPLYKFVAISYKDEISGEYGKGWKDLTFVSYYIVFFSFLREFVMQIILKPLSIKLLEPRGKMVKLNRFLEQSYAIFYYLFTGPAGFYIMYHSDLWYFNTYNMYATYPNFTNEYYYKLFYLLQGSFWAQQVIILILQVEKPRKDFLELVVHHAITILLIWLSYTFHFTKMGLSIYITMDVSDIFLSISKNLNYLDLKAQEPAFIIFIISWIYLRHYINLKILWSLLTEFQTVGNFTLNFATQQYKCWISQPIIITLLGVLQILNLYWLFLIFRVLYRMLFLNTINDERSDSEDEIEQLDEHEDLPIPESKKEQ